MKLKSKQTWFNQKTATVMLTVLLSVSLTACFESSTEVAPPSLRTPPPEAKPQPTAADDTLSVPLSGTGTVSVLDNDSAPDGGNVTIETYDDSTAHGGTVLLNADGTFTYASPADFEGEDTFTYTIKDAKGNKAQGTVIITVSRDVIPNGKSFYASNCAICHAAGSDDLTVAFNSSDLAVRANPLLKDMRVYGGEYELMGAFYDIPQHNIDELKAYLGAL